MVVKRGGDVFLLLTAWPGKTKLQTRRALSISYHKLTALAIWREQFPPRTNQHIDFDSGWSVLRPTWTNVPNSELNIY